MTLPATDPQHAALPDVPTRPPPGPRRHPLPVFSENFKADARAAIANVELQEAVEHAVVKKDYARRATLAELPDADGLRELAGQIKQHTLDHLDYYLEQLTAKIESHGGHVHFAGTAEEANQIIIDIAQSTQSKLIVKSKSMVSEETELNHALEAAGLEVLETDLGEFIIQIDHDHPSHLVMPVIHKKAGGIGKVFAEYFKTPYTADPAELAEMARVFLRERFNEADMGVSGVNFAVAETGTICLCTNEGNGRMCTSRPRTHVALMGMEKIIPRLEDLPVFLKLLARSASGQSLTQYTNLITGPRRPDEHDGPDEFHLVIMDNGRTRILSSDYRATLRCIRCGACLNACPIYRKVGGHTYGSVYPGPIGALLTPLFNGLHEHKDLPHASSLCGACFEACPVKIDIPEMLIKMRADQRRTGMTKWHEKLLFKVWTTALKFNFTYRLALRAQQFGLRRMKHRDGFIARLPGPAQGWTDQRDFPRPPDHTFRQLWKQRRQTQQNTTIQPATIRAATVRERPSSQAPDQNPPHPAPQPENPDHAR